MTADTLAVPVATTAVRTAGCRPARETDELLAASTSRATRQVGTRKFVPLQAQRVLSALRVACDR